MIQRINGLKMELGNLPDEVLTSVHAYQMARVVRGTAELGMLEVELADRGITFEPDEGDNGQLVIDFESQD
jgi:hypothetical protein